MNKASKTDLPFDSDHGGTESPAGETEDNLDRTNTMKRWALVDAEIESDEDEGSPAAPERDS